MRLRSILFVAVAVLLLPAQAMAAFCFALTSGGTAVGTVQLDLGAAAGPHVNVAGQFLNTAAFCGAAEAAEMTGSGVAVGTNAHFALVTAGTPSCFPVTIDFIVPIAPFTGNGTFNLDVPSVAGFTSGTFATTACPALQ